MSLFLFLHSFSSAKIVICWGKKKERNWVGWTIESENGSIAHENYESGFLQWITRVEISELIDQSSVGWLVTSKVSIPSNIHTKWICRDPRIGYLVRNSSSESNELYFSKWFKWLVTAEIRCVRIWFCIQIRKNSIKCDISHYSQQKFGEKCQSSKCILKCLPRRAMCSNVPFFSLRKVRPSIP